MNASALQNLRAAVVGMVLLTLVCGLGYPLAVTGLAQAAFPAQAGGSLIHDAEGRLAGSALIAQSFTKPEYLHPRPSAAGNGYDPLNSGGSNLGPLDKKLIDRVAKDAAAIAKEDNVAAAAIPADAVTTSGSGLDPDVTPANARMQALRIAAARRAPLAQVLRVIGDNTEDRAIGFLGEPRVNVLAVNRALDTRLPLDRR